MTTRERKTAEAAVPYVDPEPTTVRYRQYEEKPLAWADYPPERGSYLSPTGRPSTKWRGISLLNLRTLQHEEQAARNAARLASKFAARATEEYVQEVARVLGIQVVLGTTECTESLTLECVYPSLGMGRYGDTCLFCALTQAEANGDERHVDD